MRTSRHSRAASSTESEIGGAVYLHREDVEQPGDLEASELCRLRVHESESASAGRCLLSELQQRRYPRRIHEIEAYEVGRDHLERRVVELELVDPIKEVRGGAWIELARKFQDQLSVESSLVRLEREQGLHEARTYSPITPGDGPSANLVIMSEETPPGYNTPIPAKIMTPDRVETRLGALSFDDGRPDGGTVERLYEFLDLMRGVQVFLDCVPAASLEAMRAGLVEHGIGACHQVSVSDDLLDSNPLFLTGNTDTVYAAGVLDLERDGPTVVEIPAGCGPGTINDAWFRFVIDMGAPGPDRGRGGRYLVVPDDHEDELPEGYLVARSPSSVNWLILRGFLVDGSPAVARDMFRRGLRIYPLSQQTAPPPMEFSSFSGVPMNTVHANDVSFYSEIAAVIEREPIGLVDPETRGVLASIGIRKGLPFEPDARMRAVLEEAARIGNATARATAMAPRDPEVMIYDDRQWQTGFVGDDYQWMGGDPANGIDHDARTMFFYFATVNTPAMALKMVGVGSQYAIAFRDAAGVYLDGGAAYRLTIPAEVPAKDFWSVVVYDPQTRSELQTDQAFPSRNDKRDGLASRADGAVELFFGPEPPSEAPASNWVQTVPGKGWFAILRLYGPLDAWFDQTWKPGDIEPIG